MGQGKLEGGQGSWDALCQSCLGGTAGTGIGTHQGWVLKCATQGHLGGMTGSSAGQGACQSIPYRDCLGGMTSWCGLGCDEEDLAGQLEGLDLSASCSDRREI